MRPQEEQVEALSKLLPPIPESVLYDIYGEIYGDFDWSFSYNETDVTIGCTIGDWQVSRSIVFGMCNSIDGERYPEMKDWLEKFDEYDENGEQDDHEFSTEVTNEGEYEQTWLNCKTGEIVTRRRLDEEGRVFCQGEWENPKLTEESLGDSVYRLDISVHDSLIQAGYKPRRLEDVGSWDMDDVKTTLVQWQQAFLNPMTKKIVEIGGTEYLRIILQGDKPDYLAAAKICARNHYVPEDKALYIKYVGNLVYLGKDCHNAFYVCPKDLAAANEKMVKFVAKAEKKRKAEEERLRLLSEEKAIEDYARRAAAYAHIHLGLSNGVQVIVCPTFQDMVEEGEAMHHCVGKMGYHKKADTLVMFVREANGERVATIEYDVRRNIVRQNRGVCNSFPKYFEQVNALITANGKRFKEALEEKLPKAA